MSNDKKAAGFTDKEALAPVDKIRELLFGNQMDAYAEQFQRLETLIINETRKTADELGKRIHAMENLLNQRIELAEQAFQREQKERTQAFNTLNDALQQAVKQLNEHLARFENTAEQNLTELKKSLEHESQQLTAQIQACREELMQALNDESKRLEGQKVSRQQLTDLFSGLANELHRS